MTKRVEMAGRTFGKWLVLHDIGDYKWLCRCQCGVEKSVDGPSLRKGKSNGCIKCHTALGTRRTHGQKKSRLYNIWSGIIARCENSNSPAFPRYGGRGISMCQAWRDSFETFRDWAMEQGYLEHLTIDRQDNDLGYNPENCRWATYTEQNRNRSDNVPLSIDGRLILVSELAEQHDLPPDVVKNRIRRYGWTIEKAISTPVGKRRRSR